MEDTTTQASSTEVRTADSADAEFAAYDKEYKFYLEELRIDWLKTHRHRSNKVYEVMEPWEQEEVHQIIAAWARYVIPLVEAWWKERGYDVEWPADNDKPMRLIKREAA
ncbi:MAG TPA: hypothetical protein VHD37_01530 [Candidatus Paceibacterota bacterium]|nr:hypothetical protein [Candidatus Paceibacterota bacterium]